MTTAARSAPTLFTLIVLTGMSTLSLNMFVPSLAHMAETFGTDYATVSLAIGGYLAVTGVLQLIIGPLSDRYGRRPVLLVSLAVFCFASLGCLLAQDIWVFLAFRVLQGAVIAGSALSPAIVRDTASLGETASRLGYIAMAMAVAPMMGPMVGGVLDQFFGWRASFALFLALGLALFLLAWVDLGETNKSPSQTFLRQFSTYPALLRAPRFWAFALCMAFSTSAFYAFIAGAPIVAAQVFDISPGVVGLYIGSITGGFFLGSWVAGRLGDHLSLGMTMMLGRIVAVTGLALGASLMALGHLSETLFFVATLSVGIGNGITMPSASTGAMSVDPKLAGSASGLSGALTVGIGAVATTLSGALLSPVASAGVLLSVMWGASALGLVAALWVVWDDRRGISDE